MWNKWNDVSANFEGSMVKAPNDLSVKVDKEEKYRWNGVKYLPYNTCKCFIAWLVKRFTCVFKVMSPEYVNVQLLLQYHNCLPAYLPSWYHDSHGL